MNPTTLVPISRTPGAWCRAAFPGRFRGVPASWLIGIAWLPVIVWYVRRLDDGSDEPLGLLALALALALSWRDRRSLAGGVAARVAGALVLTASVTATGLLPPLPRAALAIAGTGLWFGLHRKPALIGLFLLSLPVVASLQFYIGYPLRLAAAEGAVRILELAGIVVARDGVNIELGGARIGVDPACAGILMLWHALLAAMALAAIHRVSWGTTLAGGLLAILLTVPANALRAAWLTLEESGRLAATGIGHGNAGLLCFAVVLAPLWLLMSGKSRPPEPDAPVFPPGRLETGILLAAALLTPFALMRPAGNGNMAPLTGAPETFMFNGVRLPLLPLPPTPEELAFARSFPGTLSSHRWGERQVILRRVTKATRRLHPSRDCLRAAGFETTHSITVRGSDGAEWSRFTASRAGERLIVHERIVSEQDGSAWTDVPTWFWSAWRHPLNGPWRAETVISR